MPAIMKRCKKELQRSATINGALKLWLAQQYNFSNLQKEFVQQYRTVEDAKKLKSEPEYKHLDANTLALLFNTII
ncbi:hypothetical protein DdX_16885 [Ditylenchus destructor]|uniref:Uncharacterized protein n=1 Tax=Ditylenchus destructor TaxID=166010 RepID=A0AAD4QWB5_9BILA|nr:hypothetical protein DdX_16885 [Ditylenchus destructor]